MNGFWKMSHQSEALAHNRPTSWVAVNLRWFTLDKPPPVWLLSFTSPSAQWLLILWLFRDDMDFPDIVADLTPLYSFASFTRFTNVRLHISLILILFASECAGCVCGIKQYIPAYFALYMLVFMFRKISFFFLKTIQKAEMRDVPSWFGSPRTHTDTPPSGSCLECYMRH